MLFLYYCFTILFFLTNINSSLLLFLTTKNLLRFITVYYGSGSTVYYGSPVFKNFTEPHPYSFLFVLSMQPKPKCEREHDTLQRTHTEVQLVSNTNTFLQLLFRKSFKNSKEERPNRHTCQKRTCWRFRVQVKMLATPSEPRSSEGTYHMKLTTLWWRAPRFRLLEV